MVRHLVATDGGNQDRVITVDTGVCELYFSRGLLTSSLELISTTWINEGQWGEQRAELLGPCAGWLAVHGVLADADVWRCATTDEFLPLGALVWIG